MTDADDVLVEDIGRAGVLTLNRPHTLNALTLAMVDQIGSALDRWERDPTIAHVILRQGSSRAFCAGGDIRTLVSQIKAGDFAEVEAFYRREYRLNRRIKYYPKPYTALIDGIVMGGGVGLSVHGRYRVGSEKLAFAMPEVGIGLFPDVGGTYFLPRMPGRLGLYLALTGERITAADALFAGVITHYVPKPSWEELFIALTTTDDPGTVLASFDHHPGLPAIEARLNKLNRLLDVNSLVSLIVHLTAAAEQADAEAQALLALLAARSPTSLAVAFRQITEGAQRDFDDCMRLEFRIVNRIIRGHDFCEGVRAVIFDKDNQPRWLPATIASLDWAVIDGHFATLGANELGFS